MIKIKLSCPPKNWNFKKYFLNNFSYSECKLCLNQNIKECDYLFICEDIADNIESVTITVNNVTFKIKENSEVVKCSQYFLN